MNEFASRESTIGTEPHARSIARSISDMPVFPSLPTASLDWDYPVRLLTEFYVASAQAPAVTVLSLLAIIVACGVTFLVGLPQMTIYGHDMFGFLDGGWRVLQGQVPHVDFYSALGPIYYLLWAAGFKVSHYRVEGIVYVTTLVGVVLGFWSLAILRNRFGALCAVVGTVFLVCFWLAPFAIGDPYYQTTYAMQYNRLGYVLFLLIFIELFGSSSQDSSATGDWAGLSSGVALGLLLFLKANFFIVALVPLAYAYVFRIKDRRHVFLLFCGFLAAAVPMTWYLHWNLSAFLTDMRIAGAARAAQKGVLIRALVRIPSRNFITGATIVGLTLLAGAFTGEENKPGFSSLNRSFPWLLLVLGCDFVLASSNMQGSGLPLSLIAILLLVDQLVRQMDSEQRRKQWALLGCFFVVIITMILPVVTDLVNAWETEIVVNMGRGAKGFYINAPQMAALGFKDHSDAIWNQPWDNGHLMTNRINDGIVLLREHTSANERIACLCFSDPFSYALLRQSPHGGSPFFDYGYNFNEKAAPTADKILGDAEVVIYPKSDEDPPTKATLLRICGPLLSKNYAYVAESEQWVLLRRRG